MKKISFVLISLFACIFCSGQPNIEWSRCFGGSVDEWPNSIIQTADSGYIFTGQTTSNDSDVSGNQGYNDVWVVKMDPHGVIQWQNCYGGTDDEGADEILQTSDGGYIFAATTRSENGGMIQGHHDTTAYLNSDFWVVKLDSSGNILWSNCFGGTSDEYAWSIIEINDGGYAISGSAYSWNWDVSGGHGGIDYWLIKIDSTGTLLWQKCLGGSDYDYGHDVIQTNDGGFMMVGSSASTNGDVTGNHGGVDYWVVKLDSLAAIQWQKCYGGTLADDPHTLIHTQDGNYLIAGLSKSNNGDVTGNHGNNDCWVIKIDSSGNLLWQNSFGGSGDDRPYSIIESVSGGYTIIASSESNDGDVIGNHGWWDFWVFNLDSTGNLQWQKCLGGTYGDFGYALAPTVDGGWMVAGGTASNDYDVTGNHGIVQYTNDCWMVKLGSYNVHTPDPLSHQTQIPFTPNPTTGKITIANNELRLRQISILNLLGETVYCINQPDQYLIELDLSLFSSGIYLLQANDMESVLVSKVVKN